jgi:hypothetical protein
VCGEDIWQLHFYFSLGSLQRWYARPPPYHQVGGPPNFGSVQVTIQYVHSQLRSTRVVRLLLTQSEDAPCCCDNLRIVCCTLYWTYYCINVYHHIKYMLMAADKTIILCGWEQIYEFRRAGACACVRARVCVCVKPKYYRKRFEKLRYDRYPLNRKYSPGTSYIDLDRWRFFFAIVEFSLTFRQKIFSSAWVMALFLWMVQVSFLSLLVNF